MKIKNGFVVREIAGQSIVVALGEASKIFNGMIKLNETGRVIWDALVKGAETEEIVEALLAEYDVDREVETHFLRHHLRFGGRNQPRG